MATTYDRRLLCHMHKHIIRFFLFLEPLSTFLLCSPHPLEIQGCLQFINKSFFTPPSTLRHRKPITTDAALATDPIMESCLYCMCVCGFTCMCVGGHVIAHYPWQSPFFTKHWQNNSCFSATKCLTPYYWVFVFVQARKCIKLKWVCMFPRGSLKVLIAIVCDLLWLPSEAIYQQPSFALVYFDIKPHMLCGKLKCTLSDSTAIPNHLYSLTKYLTMAYLLCLLVFKGGCLLACGDLHIAASHSECNSINMTF